MAFKDKVMKCIVEMGEEKTIQQISAGIAVKSAKEIDKITRDGKNDLRDNMLNWTKEAKELLDEVKQEQEKLKKLIEKLEK